MKVRNRILYVRQPEDDHSRSLFGRVLRDLHDALRRRVERTRDFPDWPNVEWQDGNRHCHVTSWSTEDNLDERLVQVKLTEQDDHVTWELTVILGSVQPDQVIIQEECETLPAQPLLPVTEAPTILGFLARYACHDADRYEIGKARMLSKSRTTAFLEFVKAPLTERRLPIVLVTPRHGDSEYALQNYRELAIHLQGMAHVVVLAKQTKWYGDDLPLSPATYNSAVRIYMPGYEEGQGGSVHRLWMPDRISELGQPLAIQEIVRLVHERSIQQPLEDETLQELARKRDDQAFQQQVKAQVQAQQQRHNHDYDALRQRIKLQVETEVSADFEALFESFQQDYQTLSDSHDRVLAEKERMEHEIRKLRDEIRSLKFQLGQRWTEPEDLSEEAEIQPTLYLSGQVWELYNSLDQGLRHAVESQLWQKLSDPILREAQKEPVPCDGGTCYVFPRGRAAEGKRVIFMLKGERVKVCELFMHHDQYETARTRGFDLAEYRNFTPWESPALVETA